MIRGLSAAWPVLACALYGGTAAAGAAAQSAGFLEPSAGARLEAGETVEVGWTLQRMSAMEFDEAELLLSLDGGKSFPLRLTREVSSAMRHLSWRVPALPTEHARLALRQGSNEDPESETIVLVGPEFTIVARPTDSLDELFRVRGEWRTRQALGSSADLPETGLADPRSKEMSAAPSHARATAPPKSVTPVSGRERSFRRFASRPALDAAEPPPLTACRGFIPLRQ